MRAVNTAKVPAPCVIIQCTTASAPVCSTDGGNVVAAFAAERMGVGVVMVSGGMWVVESVCGVCVSGNIAVGDGEGVSSGGGLGSGGTGGTRVADDRGCGVGGGRVAVGGAGVGGADVGGNGGGGGVAGAGVSGDVVGKGVWRSGDGVSGDGVGG